MKSETRKELFGYVSRNILSTVGTSIYILADTFFIANGVGPYGLTALNLALPLFNLIMGIGLLLGMGGATLFSLNKSQHPESGRHYFSQLLLVGGALGLLFVLASFFWLEPLGTLLGKSPETAPYLASYLRVVLLGAPFFILNNLCLSFVRNDNNPQLAMVAMIASSLFNVVFDYPFVFPLQLGMFGAALATLCSPILSLLILTLHRKKSNRLLGFTKTRPQFKVVMQSVQLGLPSFLTEMSAGISILVFNMVLLSLAGDIAVAAYGILANVFLVGNGIFTGSAQGIQPIVSREFGRQNYPAVKGAFKFGITTVLLLGSSLYLVVLLFKLPIIQAFNQTNNQQLIQYALQGIPVYLLSFLFSGSNIVSTIFLSAIAKPKQAFIIVLLRGYLLIIPAVFLLSQSLGLTGVWLSLPLTEAVALILAGWFIHKTFRQIKTASAQLQS